MTSLAIHSLGLLIPLLTAAILWIKLQPRGPLMAGVFLSTLWVFSSLLVLQLLATHFEWWVFDQKGVFFGMPADLFFGWVFWWGTIPVLIFQRIPVGVGIASMALLDLSFMPRCAPALVLGRQWLTGEMGAIFLVLMPAMLLARWTATSTNLRSRILLQVLLFTTLLFLVCPTIVLAETGHRWPPLHRVSLTEGIFLQLMSIAAAIGLSAVLEFMERGEGTPFPFDPPRRLVIYGIYRYLRNPMQTSVALLVVAWGVFLHNWWLVAVAPVLTAYSLGLAAWDERSDLVDRFGGRWRSYRAAVPAWLPHWRPFVEHPATIYIASSCDPCRGAAAWLQARAPIGLAIIDAELHPERDLDRIRYEAADGYSADGIVAISRALEHLQLGWAIVGLLMRLPIIHQLLQLVVDAVGGGPRLAPRRGSENF